MEKVVNDIFCDADTIIKVGKSDFVHISKPSLEGGEYVFTGSGGIEASHLLKIIEKKGLAVKSKDQLISFVLDELPLARAFCIGCQTLLDHLPEDYSYCQKKECMFTYEDLCFGNVVTNKYKNNPRLCEILLKITLEALKSTRVRDIFEPYPTKFLLENSDIAALYSVRGSVSRMLGIDISKYKDIDKLLEQKDNLLAVIENLNIFNCDKDIIDAYGLSAYYLARFCITSFYPDMKEDYVSDDGNTVIYKLFHSGHDLVPKGHVSYLFHGSKSENWHSILRNGLKICSGTQLQVNGAVHGSGIYFSDSASMALGYSGYHGYGGVGANKVSPFTLMGIYEIEGPSDIYKKTQGIFVINTNISLVQKYLLYTTKVDSASMEHLEKSFVSLKNADLQNYTLTEKYKIRLISEYKNIITNRKKGKHDIVLLFDAKYLEAPKFQFEINGLIFIVEYYIKATYPFTPPFARLTSPALQPFTPNITNKGAIFIPSLSKKLWDCNSTIMSTLLEIKVLLENSKPDTTNSISYTKESALESLTIMNF